MAQGKPIPTRFDPPVVAMLDELHQRTGLSRSDLIRRAIAFTLRHIETSGELSVLYENPTVSEPLEQRPVRYEPKKRPAKAHVPKTRAQLLAERTAALKKAREEHRNRDA